MAIGAAKAKAEQLAAGLGFALVGVQSVSERSGNEAPWWGSGVPNENNVAQSVSTVPSGSDVGTPIVPGSESLTLTLDLVFEVR